MLTRAIRGPVFHGDRFAAGYLPMDVLPDVYAYQAVVRAVAKQWGEREGRGSVTVRPDVDAALAIAALERKCCALGLAPASEPQGPELFPTVPLKEWVEEANASVALAADGRFDTLPLAVLQRLAHFGLKLRRGEWVDDTPESTASRRFTSDTPRRIREYLAAQQRPDQRWTVGTVAGATDGPRDGRVISLVTMDGTRLRGRVLRADDHRTALRAYTYEATERRLVRLMLTGMFVGRRPVRIDHMRDLSIVEGPEVQHRLQKIQSLPDDWDGEGALRVPATRIIEARRLLEDLLVQGIPRTPAVGPGGDGQIEMVWSLPQPDGSRRRVGLMLDDEPGIEAFLLDGSPAVRVADAPAFMTWWREQGLP